MADKHCPVCDAKVRYWCDHMNGLTTEEGVKCNNCGYAREYAFGAYRVILQGNVYEWSSGTPWDEVQQLEQDIRHDIERIRAALHAV